MALNTRLVEEGIVPQNKGWFMDEKEREENWLQSWSDAMTRADAAAEASTLAAAVDDDQTETAAGAGAGAVSAGAVSGGAAAVSAEKVARDHAAAQDALAEPERVTTLAARWKARSNSSAIGSASPPPPPLPPSRPSASSMPGLRITPR